MSLTHSQIISARAEKIGSLTDEAVDKISNDILSQAASRMETRLGSQGYGNYVRMFTENVYDSTKEYHNLTDGEKKLRNLETAESYYVLYFLALALRKMQEDYTSTEEDTFGDGTIQPSPINRIIEQQEQYKRHGDRIVSEYATSGVFITVI